jgi:hypothetical protein
VTQISSGHVRHTGCAVAAITGCAAAVGRWPIPAPAMASAAASATAYLRRRLTAQMNARIPAAAGPHDQVSEAVKIPVCHWVNGE